MEELSRRERRKVFREQKQESVWGEAKRANLTKWLVILVLAGVVGFIGWWFTREVTKPLPGEQFADLGRDHVTDISNTSYNSNPPTSGSHFPVWAKKGVYDRVISDGYLIHSLEHGYIVLSYNCEKKMTNAKWPMINVYARETGEPHEEIATESSAASESAKPLTRMVVGLAGTMSFFGPTNAPPIEVELPEEFRNEECKKLVDELSGFADDYQRVIIVPRPGMEERIALTAWTRLDALDSIDRERVKNFIEAYHNKGPEKTVE